MPKVEEFSWSQPPPEILEQLEEWLTDRPQIRPAVEQVPPYGWFILTTDENESCRYQVTSYGEGEDGSITVTVVRYSIATCVPMWQVFGIDPADLKPANTPQEAREELTPDELLSIGIDHEMAMDRLHAAVAARQAEEAEG